MATARKKDQAGRQVARHAARSSSAEMRLLIFEDNGGDYHWTLLDSDGESLAWSVPFATYEEAVRGARVVCDGAASARLETPPSTDQPVDLLARREAAAARESSDAERWLDDAAVPSSEAVAQWPAER